MTFTQSIKKQNDQLVALPVIDVIQEADSVRTYRLDNSAGDFAIQKPGMFAKVCINLNGEDVWRSFTISSSPLHPEQIDLTIKRKQEGIIGSYFFEHMGPGSEINIKGPLGQFYYDPEFHEEPVVLLCAGIGITPMMSIVHYLTDLKPTHSCSLFYGARSEEDLIFDQEINKRATMIETLQYFPTLSQPSKDWQGARGRLTHTSIRAKLSQLLNNRYFLCGPGQFNREFEEILLGEGVTQSHIHSEQFHKKRKSK